MLLYKQNNQVVFLLIKDLSTIFYSRTNSKHYVCRRCLEICLSKTKLQEHEELCRNFKSQKVLLPNDVNKILRFKNFRKQIEVPFIIYLDFEAILKPTNDCPTLSHLHIPIAYAYKLYSYIEGVTKKAVVYTGLDCVKVLIEELIKEYQSIEHYFELNLPLNMTNEEEEMFQNSYACHICGLDFDETRVKCRDHDHFTGRFYVIIFLI